MNVALGGGRNKSDRLPFSGQTVVPPAEGAKLKAMADVRGLKIFGWMYATLTAAVAIIAVAVVVGNAQGLPPLPGMASAANAAQTAPLP